MIQPISNNVNFGGAVCLGGIGYGAVRKLANNVSNICNPKVQTALKENLGDVQKYIAGISPKGADLSLTVQSKTNFKNSSSKVTLLLQDNSKPALDPVFSVSRNFRQNGRIYGVEKLCTNAKDKATNIFNKQSIQDKAQHLDINV